MTGGSGKTCRKCIRKNSPRSDRFAIRPELATQLQVFTVLHNTQQTVAYPPHIPRQKSSTLYTPCDSGIVPDSEQPLHALKRSLVEQITHGQRGISEFLRNPTRGEN